MQADNGPASYLPPVSPEHIYLATMLISLHMANLQIAPVIGAEHPGNDVSMAVAADNKLDHEEMEIDSMSRECLTVEREPFVSLTAIPRQTSRAHLSAIDHRRSAWRRSTAVVAAIVRCQRGT